ncbi:HAD family hydrolase [Mycolicibacterium helvum]|uniref:Haloacid dehalogenase n=1 Tax=Mycolicibacterium helvum TaxID=1534349 RepID=A0A7I7T5Z0_9MYCO|nr:HAD family phosphatase [Mycolicibacterium helvum]BBY64213.1 haloacid dehalogenase [Mycolicibacterium helvum]
MTLPQSVSAIVFDCDGLLLDTETCWSRAEAALFADYGFGFGPQQKDLLIGRTLAAACDNIAEYFGRPGMGPQLEAELLPRVEAELAADVQPMPGARSLLELLGDKVPIAVATNSPRAILTAALESSGLAGYFDVSIAADEVERPKPDPQLYLEAFALLNADPMTGVALEDSSTGVAAARAAHTFLITVPSQPGKQLDGDYVTAALNDPALVAWAQGVTHRP